MTFDNRPPQERRAVLCHLECRAEVTREGLLKEVDMEIWKKIRIKNSRSNMVLSRRGINNYSRRVWSHWRPERRKRRMEMKNIS
jgi:hypothetical protein